MRKSLHTLIHAPKPFKQIFLARYLFWLMYFFKVCILYTFAFMGAVHSNFTDNV